MIKIKRPTTDKEYVQMLTAFNDKQLHDIGNLLRKCLGFVSTELNIRDVTKHSNKAKID